MRACVRAQDRGPSVSGSLTCRCWLRSRSPSCWPRRQSRLPPLPLLVRTGLQGAREGAHASVPSQGPPSFRSRELKGRSSGSRARQPRRHVARPGHVTPVLSCDWLRRRLPGRWRSFPVQTQSYFLFFFSRLCKLRCLTFPYAVPCDEPSRDSFSPFLFVFFPY